MTSIDEVASDWLDHLRVEKGASPHTVSSYARDVRRFIADLGERGIDSIDQVTRADLQSHLQRFSAGELTGQAASPATVARATSSIRALYRFALREGLITEDPTALVHPPRLGDHLPKALTIDEVDRLLGAAHEGDGPAQLRAAALLEVLYATGARVSEAINLTVDDIDLDAELPVVRLIGKGRKERLVPLGSYAREAVSAYITRARPALAQKGKSQHKLFLGQRGGPLSRQAAWDIVTRCAAVAGLEGRVSPHTLRHSFATHLLEGGASVRDVQELLGHASVVTTQIYTRITALTLREVHRTSHPRARRTPEPQG